MLANARAVPAQHAQCRNPLGGGEGTPIRLDNALLPDMLERLRFRSRRGERPLKHVENGRLKSIVSLQGIYRLSEASAADFETLVLAAAG